MRTLWKITRRLLKTLGGIVAVIALFLAAEFVLSSIAVEGEAGTKPEVDIFLLTNGVHTDIVMPLRTPQTDWTRNVKFSDTTGKDTTARYVGIGWGDKGFYMEIPTWSDLTPRVAFNAAFGLDGTALHTTFYHTMHEGEDCRRISISKAQYARLVAYIENWAQTDSNGRFINIETNANYDSNDAFYEGKGHYSLFHSCNTWVNNALKTSGLRHCKWTLFKRGIFAKYPLAETAEQMKSEENQFDIPKN